jgi:hypothetical protein
MIALSNSVHLFARPEVRDKLLDFYTNVLGLEPLISGDAPGAAQPIVAFRFANGAALSIDFTEDALDDTQARRGAWIELQSDDADTLQQKVIEAGCPRIKYAVNNHFYFQAPGGQVMRIVALRKA